MDYAHLQRCDPARNMARFYEVDVRLTLFGEASVVRSWGRIGSYGRTTLETFATTEAASLSAGKTVRSKLARGYLATP